MARRRSRKRNLVRTKVPIHDLAGAVVRAAGSGRLEERPVPPEVAAMDVVAADLDTSRIEGLLGPIAKTPLPDALAATAADVRARLSPLPFTGEVETAKPSG